MTEGSKSQNESKVVNKSSISLFLVKNAMKLPKIRKPLEKWTNVASFNF